MTDDKRERRMAEGAFWGGRPSAGASGPLKPSSRKAAAGSPAGTEALQFAWRPDAPDFPAPLHMTDVTKPVLRTGENPYAALPPFEFPFPVHETTNRTPAKIIPPVFAVLVAVGAFLARDSWLPNSSGEVPNATPTVAATQVTVTATEGQSLLTQVAGQGAATTTATIPATPASTTPEATITTTTTPDDAPAGFEPGLVEAAEGDTLIIIADAIGLNVSTLVWANDVDDPGAPLEAGTLVVVPSTDGVLHTVVGDESLASIAATYGVDPSVITGVEENGVVSDLDIKPDMVLLIPGAALPSRDNVAIYTVRDGDNLWGIADYYGLNPFTLAWANDLAEPFVIQDGQELTIPPADGIYHQVAVGETVESIAAAYGVDAALIRGFAFNQMQDPFAQPKVGQPLVIPSLDALVQVWGDG